MGGIFFDRNLGTSSRLFEFVMRMLVRSPVRLHGCACMAVPLTGGMACAFVGRGGIQCHPIQCMVPNR